MVNLFVRLEVQRRYFSVVSMEMLALTFGMKEPSSLEALLSTDRPITLEQLLYFGRNLTIDQFLETKNEFDRNEQLREELIRDRETFIIHNDKKNIKAPFQTRKAEPVILQKKKPEEPVQNFNIFAQFMVNDKKNGQTK